MSTLPRWWKAILALAIIALLAGFAWYYYTQRQRLLREINANLESISQLKVNWISEWRSARRNEAAIAMASRFYTPLSARWMKGPRAPEDVQTVLTGLSAAKPLYKYHDALFVSATGEVYFSLSGQVEKLQKESQQSLVTAFQTQNSVLSELYSAPGDSHPQMDLIAPFFINTGNGSLPSGALIYQYDAREFLYPILQFWPAASRSAETMLIRRDGDSVLFINELRHKKDTALTLSTPLSDIEAIAVKASLGQQGVIEGKDYRGVKVLSMAKPVPDTSWLMIAKQDEDEALSGLRRESVLTLAMITFIIASVSTALGVLWQRNGKAYYRALFEAEAAKKKTEERYRSTLDAMLEGCQIIDFDWHYLYLNASAIRHSRHTKEELMNSTLMECFPGIETSEVFAAFNRCMHERTLQHIEFSLDLPDGSRRWYEVVIRPVPEGIFVVTIDITDRKQTADNLRESEAKYRTLFEHLTQGIYLMRFDGKIIDVNPAALRMFGLTKDDFMKKAWESPYYEFVREDGSLLPIEEYPSVVAQRTGTAVNMIVGVKNPQSQSHVWMEVNAIPEFSKGTHEPYQVLVTLHDITDRKRVEAEHDRLASAIAQSGEVVVIIDTNRLVQYINPVFETVTGTKREESIGRPLPITEVQNEEFYKEFWATLESGKPWKGRLVNRKKDGSLYTEAATVTPVFNKSGAIVNYVSVTRDITEYLQLQDEKEKLQEQFIQAQKMESVGRLAGGVAHDFNNMLSVISGHSQLALDLLDSAHPLYPHLQEINRAAVRSAELTRQLLAFARKQTISPKVLDLNSTIGGSLNMLQRLIGENIDLAWMPGHNLWPVNIDPTQIDQILANLTVNARDAIDKQGKITIETENMFFDEAYCDDHHGFMPGEYVMLALSDDGCGMSKDVIEHLFEPFFTTKKVGEGTGLGLSTVYGIVKQNEGFINVYSEPGRGTTFKIYFPRHSGTPSVEKTERAPAQPVGGSETILLVEDELAVLKLSKILLERLGYSVITATSPSEAIRLSESYSGEIHLLLVDVVMPEMTGRELSEQLSLLRPKIKRLYMSGYTANVIAHRGVLDEGVHFIQKPFSAAALATKVREALEK